MKELKNSKQITVATTAKGKQMHFTFTVGLNSSNKISADFYRVFQGSQKDNFQGTSYPYSLENKGEEFFSLSKWKSFMKKELSCETEELSFIVKREKEAAITQYKSELSKIHKEEWREESNTRISAFMEDLKKLQKKHKVTLVVSSDFEEDLIDSEVYVRDTKYGTGNYFEQRLYVDNYY